MLLVTPWWHTPTGWSHWTGLGPGEWWRAASGACAEAVCWCLSHQSLSSLCQTTNRTREGIARDPQVAGGKVEQPLWGWSVDDGTLWALSTVRHMGKVNVSNNTSQGCHKSQCHCHLALFLFFPPNPPLRNITCLPFYVINDGTRRIIYFVSNTAKLSKNKSNWCCCAFLPLEFKSCWRYFLWEGGTVSFS